MIALTLNNAGLIIGILFVAIIVIIFLVIPCISLCLGRAIKFAIESLDEEILGVQVEIDRLWVNPFSLAVTIEGCYVENPPGYTSKYILQTDHVTVDISAITLLCSCGSKIVVEELALGGIDINVEKNSLKSSNIQDLLRNITGNPDSAKFDKEHAKMAAAATTERGKKKGSKKILIQKVTTKNIAVQLQAWFVSLKLKPNDIDFEELTQSEEGQSLSAVIALVIEALLQSVLDNIPGASLFTTPGQTIKGGDASSESADSTTEEELEDGCWETVTCMGRY